MRLGHMHYYSVWGMRGFRAIGIVRGQPFRLCVDARDAYPAPLTPRTCDGAGSSSKVGDHLAGASAGHTLPRPVGLLGSILAICLLACHEAIRLAFRR